MGFILRIYPSKVALAIMYIVQYIVVSGDSITEDTTRQRQLKRSMKT